MTRENPSSTPLAFLDAWLWRRGIRQPAIRALLCHEAAAALLALVAGAVHFAFSSLVFSFKFL